MSNPGEGDLTPIDGLSQLAGYFEAGCKPAARFRIGTEHEKFGFRHDTLAPPPYEPGGIRAMLEGIGADGWTPILDKGQPIGLTRGGASVSLEPAGQFELSGGLCQTLHETKAELDEHLAEVRKVAEPLGLGFAPLGFHPLATRDEMPWMPKGRYGIMRAYMPKVGTRGLDMMTRTCTVQVNLDFASEADMVRKLRVSLALQSFATALFANSPFYEGKPNGALSNRALVWTDTDNARSGIPAVVFEDGFGFERFADFALDVPMYFVYRDGHFIDTAGRSFRDFMAGKLAGLEGQRPTMGDFADHLTTLFTDVRLKRFLEMRGADAGSPAMMTAFSAFWVGLLYDDAALTAAEELVRGLSAADLMVTRAAVPTQGLDAPWRKGKLRDLLTPLLTIVEDGLAARGQGEGIYLEPLREIAAGAPTQAEYWLARYNGAWAGDVRPIFAEAAI
ncbi:glutamate--cysteine ligase [Acidisoma silvae]|uniref:Glutamate--cysteine ligase n=1 Tax=Acidisoma silvae TaxID=2802396 RepID=A0A963YRA8_9PROT|nr:glutamate--cysteine ligase [Acidisoma silvae]MCB8875560.1 glutamate--cysteine ligase [Acidisoma silvae]